MATETLVVREGIDKATFKKIFRDHWDEFNQAHPRYNSDYNDQVIQKMLDCGDPEKMGFVQYRCCSCGESRRIAFTCKSCFCLSCAKVYADHCAQFLGRMVQHILPKGFQRIRRRRAVRSLSRAKPRDLEFAIEKRPKIMSRLPL